MVERKTVLEQGQRAEKYADASAQRLLRSGRLAVLLVRSAGMLLRVLSSLTVGSHLLCVVCRLPRASGPSYLRTYPAG
jgi:hypothetical protein